MRKRRHHGEQENHERWLVSYADFITLLFAFFTVLYAISNKDLEKSKEFEESIKRSFALMGFGGLPESQNHGNSGPGSTNEGAQLGASLKVDLDLFPKKGTGPSELADYLKRQLGGASQDSRKTGEGLSLTVRHDAIGARISLAASALFDIGSAKLRPTAHEELEKIAKILSQAPNKIIVEGHTDNQPISSPNYPSNWELAGARSAKIVRYLIKYTALKPSQLVVLSYADQRPIATNATEEGRSKNRRVEILLVTDDSK